MRIKTVNGCPILEQLICNIKGLPTLFGLIRDFDGERKYINLESAKVTVYQDDIACKEQLLQDLIYVYGYNPGKCLEKLEEFGFKLC